MTDRSDQQGRYAEDRETKAHFTVHNLFLRSPKENDEVLATILSLLKGSYLNGNRVPCEQPPSYTGVSCLIPIPQILKTYLACSFMYVYVCVYI